MLRSLYQLRVVSSVTQSGSIESLGQIFMSSPTYSTSSRKSGHNYYLRKRRKWPLSPFKTKWHQTFSHQLAMQNLQDSVNLFNHSPINLLSALVDSFAVYECDPTPNAYHFVIKTLMKTPSAWDEIPEVLDHLQKVADFETPEWIFVDLIKFYGDSDMLDHAIELFFKMPNFRCNPSVHSFNALLLGICKKNWKLEAVPQILVKGQLMNIRIDESSFGILIRALCRNGKIKHAIELVRYMVNQGFTLDEKICSLIVSKMCDRNGYDKVEIFKFLEEMRTIGVSPKRFNWYNVIHFLVKNGKCKDALEVFHQMKMDGVEPNVVCYNLVLEGLVEEGFYGEADELFDDMLVSGLVPDILTYNAYISGLCKQNKVEEGAKMLASVEELGCRPDMVSYNTILQAFFQEGKLAMARDLLVQIKNKGVEINMQTYEIMIGGMVVFGEFEEACGLFVEMVGKHCSICQSVALDEMIRVLCLRGSFDKAVEVLNRMVEKDVGPGVRAWEALLEQASIYH